MRFGRIVLIAGVSLVVFPALEQGVRGQEPDAPVTRETVQIPGPPVRRVPGAPGPTPAMGEPEPAHRVSINIGGYGFDMKPGPCVAKVEAAIQVHDDLFTGDPACDEQIRKARERQRKVEAKDPAYANAPRIGPAPTPAPGERNGD